ncbi:MAG: hypothetical protein PHV57_07625 [Methanomicrobiaceae archaeon]|nr:hypothetical protein [Methanomicrobiaceae archaeon]
MRDTSVPPAALSDPGGGRRRTVLGVAGPGLAVVIAIIIASFCISSYIYSDADIPDSSLLLMFSGTPTPEATPLAPTREPTPTPLPSPPITATPTVEIRQTPPPTPAPTPARTYPRPSTSQITGERTWGGANELLLYNTGGRDDAVAVFTPAGSSDPILSVYIRQGEKYSIQYIWDGSYDLYFTTGKNWDPFSKRFTADKTFRKFPDTFDFASTIRTSTMHVAHLFDEPGEEGEYILHVPEERFPKL